MSWKRCPLDWIEGALGHDVTGSGRKLAGVNTLCQQLCSHSKCVCRPFPAFHPFTMIHVFTWSNQVNIGQLCSKKSSTMVNSQCPIFEPNSSTNFPSNFFPILPKIRQAPLAWNRNLKLHLFWERARMGSHLCPFKIAKLIGSYQCFVTRRAFLEEKTCISPQQRVSHAVINHWTGGTWPAKGLRLLPCVHSSDSRSPF